MIITLDPEQKPREPFLPQCWSRHVLKKLSPEPGFYSRVPWQDYRLIDCPTQTSLKPKRKKGKISRKARTEGNAANDLILQPSVFDEEYVCLDTQFDLRTKAGKEAYAAAKEDYPGKRLLRPNEWAAAMHALNLVQQSPQVKAWRDAAGETELTMIAELKDGIMWKGRLDKDTPYFLSDLKLFHCIDEQHFLDMAPKFLYHVQAALYSDLYYTLSGVWKPWYWIVISQQADRAFAVKCPDTLINAGRRHYEDLGWWKAKAGV